MRDGTLGGERRAICRRWLASPFGTHMSRRTLKSERRPHNLTDAGENLQLAKNLAYLPLGETAHAHRYLV